MEWHRTIVNLSWLRDSSRLGVGQMARAQHVGRLGASRRGSSSSLSFLRWRSSSSSGLSIHSSVPRTRSIDAGTSSLTSSGYAAGAVAAWSASTRDDSGDGGAATGTASGAVVERRAGIPRRYQLRRKRSCSLVVEE